MAPISAGQNASGLGDSTTACWPQTEKEACFSNKPPIRFINGDSIAARLSPGATLIYTHWSEVLTSDSQTENTGLSGAACRYVATFWTDSRTYFIFTTQGFFPHKWHQLCNNFNEEEKKGKKRDKASNAALSSGFSVNMCKEIVLNVAISEESSKWGECCGVIMCAEDQLENNIKIEHPLLSCSNSNCSKMEQRMQEQPWNKASTSNKKENKRRHSFYCQKKKKQQKTPRPSLQFIAPFKRCFQGFHHPLSGHAPCQKTQNVPVWSDGD